MKTVDEKLNDALELSGEIMIAGNNLPERVQVENQTDEENLNTDLRYTRENLYNLIERGTDAIEELIQVAKESEHPRAYEVAGNLIKQVSEVTEKLGDLQEKMRKLKEVPNNAPKNVTNALFVGSTMELQKMLKDNIGDESN